MFNSSFLPLNYCRLRVLQWIQFAGWTVIVSSLVLGSKWELLKWSSSLDVLKGTNCIKSAGGLITNGSNGTAFSSRLGNWAVFSSKSISLSPPLVLLMYTGQNWYEWTTEFIWQSWKPKSGEQGGVRASKSSFSGTLTWSLRESWLAANWYPMVHGRVTSSRSGAENDGKRRTRTALGLGLEFSWNSTLDSEIYVFVI